MPTGVVTLDFGAFPGASEAAAFVTGRLAELDAILALLSAPPAAVPDAPDA